MALGFQARLEAAHPVVTWCGVLALGERRAEGFGCHGL